MRLASLRLRAAACGLALFAVPASAAELLCYPRDELFARLEASHGERPVFVGVTSRGALLEVLAGPDGTFTAVVSLPEGLACPLAAGEGWRAAPRPHDGPAT